MSGAGAGDGAGPGDGAGAGNGAENPGEATIREVNGKKWLHLKYETADATELAVTAAVDAAPYLVAGKVTEHNPAITGKTDAAPYLTGGKTNDPEFSAAMVAAGQPSVSRITELAIDNGTLLPRETVRSVVDGILQAARIKITRNDYISCPTCGRTKFDLPTAVAKVKKATSHLKGLKIAVMGCVVNGPGEMADADYGYVGAGRGLVHLYRGKNVAKLNVPEDKAADELLKLIAADGRATE